MDKKDGSTDSGHSLQSQDTELIEESFDGINSVSLSRSSVDNQDVYLLARIGSSSREPSITDFLAFPNESATKACSTPHDSKKLLSQKRKFTNGSSGTTGDCKKQRVLSEELSDIRDRDSSIQASEISPDVSDISSCYKPTNREGKKSVCFTEVNSSHSFKETITQYSSTDSSENMSTTVRCPLKTFNKSNVPRKNVKEMNPDELHVYIQSLENELKKATELVRKLQNIRKIQTKENIKEDKGKHLTDKVSCSLSYIVDDTDGELVAISLKQMTKSDFHETKHLQSSLSSGSMADSSGSEPICTSRGPSLASLYSTSTTSSTSSGSSLSGIVHRPGQFRIPQVPETKKTVNYKLPKSCVCQCFCSTVVDCLNKNNPRFLAYDTSSTSSENVKSSDSQEHIPIKQQTQINIIPPPVSSSENDSISHNDTAEKCGFTKFRHRLSTYKPKNDNLPVFAKWPANSFVYPGIVENTTEEMWHSSDSLVVIFCDGTVRKTSCEHLFPAHLLPFGSEVSFEEDGVTQTANLISVDKFYNNDLVFMVKAEEKDITAVPFQKIFLSKYCFKGLKRNNSSLTPGKTAKFSISTANVQEGKRTRKIVKFENYSGKISSGRRGRMKRFRSGTNSRSSDNKSTRKKLRSRNQKNLQTDNSSKLDADTTPHSNISQVHQVNRKLYDEERPSCSQTQKKEIYSSTDSEATIEVNLEDVYDKNLDEELVKHISQRSAKSKSLKRQNADLKNIKTVGPIPHEKIFSGYNFVLTQAKPKEITIVKRDSPSYSDEESGTDMEDYYHTTIPFDYIRLKEQIMKGGGRVYRHVLAIPKTEFDKTIVISNNIVETPNYLMAVSLSIPIYRHDLIINCCVASKHVSMMLGYGMRLPLGRSLNTGDWIDKLSSSTPLKDFKCLIALTSGEKSINFWRKLLTNLGAVAIPYKGFTESIQHIISFIVGDEEISVELKDSALIHDIPIVSTTWVIQTVISGKSQAYTSKPQYIIQNI